jgi:Lon protease-like protein
MTHLQPHEHVDDHEVLDDMGMAYGVDRSGSGRLSVRVRVCGRIRIGDEVFEYDRDEIRVQLKKVSK